jgi:hypothetical protein
MKKISICCAILIACLHTYAQDPALKDKQLELAQLELELKQKNDQIAEVKSQIATLTPPLNWKKGGFSSLNFNSVGLTDWAAGGVQSNSVTALANLFADYKKNNISWSNNLDLAYGIIANEGDEAVRKNEDKIDYLSKFGYAANSKLNYAILANIKSQFAPGFDLSSLENPVEISKFLAPAFINLSLGMDYKLNSYLSIYFSPAAGKFTIVNDDSIAAMNLYIPSTTDAQGKQFYNDHFRSEFGAFFNVLLNKDLSSKINLRSRLDLFNNYTDKNAANRENIDVNWETMVNMKLTKYIGASLFTHIIYDNDVEVATAYDANDLAIAFGPRLQFKRVFGLGFSYKF